MKRLVYIISLLMLFLLMRAAAMDLPVSPWKGENISLADTLIRKDSVGIRERVHARRSRNSQRQTYVNPMDSILRMEADSVRNVIPDSVRSDVNLPDSLVALPGVDSLSVDTMQSDTVAEKKDALDAPVKYEAKDSVIYLPTEGFAHFYGSGKVNYQNIELTSDVISMSMDSSIVRAHGVADSLGVLQGKPVFKEGDTEYVSETMSYNFKTKKGYITNVDTQQGEGFLTSQRSKKGANDELYLEHGKYTTCDAEHPHFYIALSRAKVRPKKDVVFGPAWLVVEDVPIPFAIPFGFFPFSSSYSSGFIMPSYGDDSTRGFYLRDGGYYFAVSDRMDLKLTGEIYTKGSWGLSASSSYAKRYRYRGSFNADYQVYKTGEKNMPDYSVQKSFRIQWTHSQDSKANPNSTFSASVNYSTSSYDKNSMSSLYDPSQYAQSTKTSSISYSRTFPDIGLSISSSANVSMSSKDSTISMTLPDLNISLARFYPFKRKKAAGKERWYEKIAMSYTGNLSNSITTKEDQLLHSSLIKDWRNGFKHTIPVTASFTLFKYINITPTFNYTERWYSFKEKRSWDEVNQVEVRDTTYGFNRVYNYDLSLSASTKIYGFYKPWRKLFGDKIQMIRHVITPSVSYSYAPDFSSSRYGYYDTYMKTDADGNVSAVTYSPYSGGLYGVPGAGKTGMISMSLSNNVEMKMKDRNDSIKKISLIDELTANMSYNMAAKEKPWSDLSLNIRLKLSKSYTFNMNAVFATYAYELDENGNPYVGNHTEWGYGRFGRFQGTSQHLSYTFNNDTFKKWFGKKEDKDKDKGKTQAGEEEDDDDSEEEGTTRKKPEKGGSHNESADVDSDGYMKFKMPWSFTVSYSVTMAEDKVKEKFNKKTMRYPYKFTHQLNFSGSLKLSNAWNVSYSSGYDFNYHKLSTTTVNINRDLHCFSLSGGLVLSSYGYTSYNFTIRANAGTLTDALKYDKRSAANNAVQWY